MAISNLMPRKTMRNRSRPQSINERIEYDEQDIKTQNGKLISSFQCSPESAAQEFEIAHQLYYQISGHSQPKERDIIMYRVIQSFKPGEISPEEANRIGYELAMKFTGGQHQFIVATHTDTAHIHNHIEFNSVNLNCDGKFQNVKNSAMILRNFNDEICRAHGLSVIENPRGDAKEPGEAAAIKHGVSFKEQLRRTIDRILPDCLTFEDFLTRMRSEGYAVKRGKYLEFRAPGQPRYTRSFRLGDAYTLDALRERRGKQRGDASDTAKDCGAAKTPVQTGKAQKKESTARPVNRNVNLLIDIQARMAAGKGPGYERWAKIFNLKEAAKTLNFLIDHNLTDYDELSEKAERAGVAFDASAKRIKKLEARMAEIAQLKTHIIRYSKTRKIYADYKKSRQKQEFLAAHTEEIAQHEAAKKAFDALNGKPIPKVAQLSEKYAKLLAAKQTEYERFKQHRQEMIDYQTAKQNVDRILGIQQEEEQKRQRNQREEDEQRREQNQNNQEH